MFVDVLLHARVYAVCRVLCEIIELPFYDYRPHYDYKNYARTTCNKRFRLITFNVYLNVCKNAYDIVNERPCEQNDNDRAGRTRLRIRNVCFVTRTIHMCVHVVTAKSLLIALKCQLCYINRLSTDTV